MGGGVHDGRVVRTRATDVWLWYRSLTGSLLVERRGVGRSHSVWWWPTAASEVCLKERPCGPVVGRSVWWWRVWGLTQMSRSRRHVARVTRVRERRGNALRVNTNLAELLGTWWRRQRNAAAWCVLGCGLQPAAPHARPARRRRVCYRLRPHLHLERVVPPLSSSSCPYPQRR